MNVTSFYSTIVRWVSWGHPEEPDGIQGTHVFVVTCDLCGQDWRLVKSDHRYIGETMISHRGECSMTAAREEKSP